MLRIVAAMVAFLLPRLATADRVVAVAPVSVVGVDDKSAATKSAISQVEQALGRLPGTTVVPAAKVAAAIDRAKKPHLRTCDGDARCFAELGRLVGAQIVVNGMVGGLGDLQVIYFGATEVATGQDVRSTTLTVGANDGNGGPAGAAIRLLDPDKFLGTLRLAIDVEGASVFVNGAKVTLTRNFELTLPVGTHALRVTHPRYRDFIRFVTVAYDQIQDLSVSMGRHPMIEHSVETTTSRTEAAAAPPWYRRWYVAVPTLIALSVGTGFAVAAIVHQFPGANDCRTRDGQGCP